MQVDAPTGLSLTTLNRYGTAVPESMDKLLLHMQQKVVAADLARHAG